MDVSFQKVCLTKLISGKVDNVANDPTMQLLIWEQLCHFDWRKNMELWTEVGAMLIHLKVC
jgi:hypothetical protein